MCIEALKTIVNVLALACILLGCVGNVVLLFNNNYRLAVRCSIAGLWIAVVSLVPLFLLIWRRQCGA